MQLRSLNASVENLSTRISAVFDILSVDLVFKFSFISDDFVSTRKFQGRLTRLICGDSEFKNPTGSERPERGPSNLRTNTRKIPRRFSRIVARPIGSKYQWILENLLINCNINSSFL